jgi:hypothetical protein
VSAEGVAGGEGRLWILRELFLEKKWVRKAEKPTSILLIFTVEALRAEREKT